MQEGAGGRLSSQSGQSNRGPKFANRSRKQQKAENSKVVSVGRKQQGAGNVYRSRAASPVGVQTDRPDQRSGWPAPKGAGRWAGASRPSRQTWSGLEASFHTNPFPSSLHAIRLGWSDGLRHYTADDLGDKSQADGTRDSEGTVGWPLLSETRMEASRGPAACREVEPAAMPASSGPRSDGGNSLRDLSLKKSSP